MTEYTADSPHKHILRGPKHLHHVSLVNCVKLVRVCCLYISLVPRSRRGKEGLGTFSLGPRPSRDSRTKEGLGSRHSSSIWDGPIRLQDFACHAIVTFKRACDGFADHALVAEMRMRISLCHMI